ncbi:LacI family transcriptional regulator [Paenibacillus sp. CAA11]|uniref:LacI family DNA-binding transcriptional regulator n=1 Tax=Paenibacillus sp. CAA11 TaxID=1532905 RepID=UPI000D33EB5D|nr:LacI family DNA-binding transcriptional regulator [Paenibacillus sp. CAA11]AWB45232.1 LacI family transcriptional regulator [Paenibacillus sp. CAA11]
MARPKKISMQTIADRLQISRNAVSLALSDKKGVSEEIRHRVIEAAKELGYGPYAKKEAESPNLLVLVPERIMSYEDNEHFHFYHDLIWGLEAAIRKKGYNAVIARIDCDMEYNLKLPGVFANIEHAGVILFGIVRREYAKLVWEQEGRLVMFDSYYRGLPCPVVSSANIEGAYQAVSYLLQQGHRRIGFIGPVNLTTSHDERWFGYWKALQDGGVIPDPKHCLIHSAGFDSTRKEVAEYLSGLDSLPTAFFCGNDRIALMLSELLKEQGVRVPEDVSVMGFDDLKVSEHAEPPLTTMRVGKDAMTAAAVELLLSLDDPKREAIRWEVPAELIVRGSISMLE